MQLSHTPEASRRLAYVDLAKCVALCLIIIAHTQWYVRVSFFDDMRLITFWICAGFTSRPDVNLKRKSRLIVNYFVMTAICMIVSVFYFKLPFSPFDLTGALYARFCLYPDPFAPGNTALMPLCNSVLWFLPALFTSYCLFKIIMMLRGFGRQAAACAVSIAIGSALTLLPFLLPWSADSAFIFAVFMCMGQWVRKYDLFRHVRLPLAIACLILYAVLAHFTGYINLSIRNYGNCWPLLLPTAFFGVLTLLLLCRYLENTWIARIAVEFNSQALFIFGMQLVFIGLADQWFGSAISDWKLRVGATVALCFIGGWLTGRLYNLIISVVKCLWFRTLTKNGSGF